jgi:hypothetical protein
VKLAPSLEAALLDEPMTPVCPSACCFNGTCPTRVQQAAARLWGSGILTPSNYQVGCYRFEHLAKAWRDSTGRADPPATAEELREVLLERLALEDVPPPPPRVAAVTDPEAIALRQKFEHARDAARRRRDVATKATWDRVHPQQELGV